MKKNFLREGLIIFTIVIVVYILIKMAMNITVADINYTKFNNEVENRNIKKVTFVNKTIVGDFASLTNIDGNNFSKFRTQIPFADPNIVDKLIKFNVSISVRKEGPSFFEILSTVGFFAITLILFFMIFKQMSGANSNAMNFGKMKTNLNKNVDITFKDVAGIDEVKEELEEIIEFLKNPKKFTKLGGKIPKGVLLVGPPGTGKTLLAKAVAGEAGVPFLTVSGSEFVELFVGVGASRVRDLFNKAKQLAPSIVFIDEIDAVGRHRGAGLGGGHDEREQTLNQLLVEMDGFEGNEGVIVISATNRPDILDPALLRPGRFDRRVVVPLPDIVGREGILRVHTEKIPLSRNVRLKVVAQGTPGMSGADIANLVNEAALLAARKDKEKVEMEDFEIAKDKVLMGLERKSLVLSKEEKRSIAYHETGHALVGYLIKYGEEIHKITIIPRGMSLGVTVQLPKKERHNYNKEYLLDQIAVLLGGRAAEEIFLKTKTTGAENDIQRSTELARNMITRWGMSETIGPLSYGSGNQEIFLGKDLVSHKEISEDTANLIDEEIKKIIHKQYLIAMTLLKKNKALVETIVKKLIKTETITGTEFKKTIKKFNKKIDK
ncbi:ATP-dependent zinc metalloprotease FtsH [bacterium]|nr:ATP-dependent zinc metalloprotease FtsH [bacterium]